ncbi:MAG TPA: deoxyribonuclease IV [Blastocatellia bacterium]|nr:deoxyribonuclease IV [Blastocatellia bacterium]
MIKTAAPIVGAHTSIAGGLPNAVRSAVEKGCDCFQIFARNPRGWLAREPSPEEVREFRQAREQAALWPFAIHSIYLINLASQDPAALARSRHAFRQELKRSVELGAEYLVVHPGNPRTAPAEVGIATAVESIRESARGLNLSGLTILIENTAGQGSSIGRDFEQVADILAALDDLPVGVCLDTAHTFASGYDISTEAGLKKTVRAINRSFGFDRIKLIHCNDSKAPCGARVDRHQHIGLGHIGADAFRRLTRDSKFRRIPFILETPVDSERDDRWNISRLRELSEP